MTVIISHLDIQCTWNGILTGILLKNDSFEGKTRKFIGIHGWQDNLNSMLPLAKQLIDRHPDFEMYLYDRAGHGFSSHYPKGVEYTDIENVKDLRMAIQTLGWDNEQYVIIGHSYGAIFGTIYTACYTNEVQCLIAIDCLPREQLSSDLFYPTNGKTIDKNLDFYRTKEKNTKDDLTFDKAVEIIKSTRTGISNEAAKLLTERSVRSVSEDNRIYFTRDYALNIRPIYPYTRDVIESAVRSIKSPVLFIGTSSTLWPKPYKTIDLLQQFNPHFESVWLNGSHHIHMDKVDEVLDRIEQYLQKYILQSVVTVTENSKL